MDAVQGSETMGEDIVAGMNLMGYDAMALGPKDLALGASLLQQRIDQAEFAVLSANALWRETGEFVGQPYLVKDLGSHHVGIIGLTRLPDEPLADIDVLDPQEALAKVVPEASRQAETVVLLTNLPFEDAKQLVKTVPGIDLVVAALPGQLPDRAVRIAETGTLAVVADQPSVGHTGRCVGRLAVMLGSDGLLSGESWTSVPMGPEFADDPEMAELLENY
jgi:2',3'-cyclic-nucleotide 2'-phosphodiesterase (5'-nucleotidase family)